MINRYYQIRFSWRGREETPAALAGRYLKTIEALVEALPDFFQPWHILDVRMRREIPFAMARHVMTQVVENNVVRDDDGEPSRIYGYHLLSANRLKTTPHTMRFKVDGGSKIDNEAVLEIGDILIPSDPSMVRFDFFEPAMRIIAEHWDVDWACAQLYMTNYDRNPKAPPWRPRFPGSQPLTSDLEPGGFVPQFPGSKFQIPWFAYLAQPFARNIDLPPDMPSRIVPGGLMIVPMEERLDPDNPVHIRRARTLQQFLQESTRSAGRPF